MLESASLLAAVLIEAVLLLLILVGGAFWFLKSRRETPTKNAGLSFPDELAGHARRFLENEIASTREQMETRGEADDMYPALDLRLSTLSAELDGLDLTEARDSFWKHINERYGAKVAATAPVNEPAEPPPAESADPVAPEPPQEGAEFQEETATLRDAEPEPEPVAGTDPAPAESADNPDSEGDSETDMDDIDRLLAESQPQSASEAAEAEPDAGRPPAEEDGMPDEQAGGESPSTDSEKPEA